MPLTTTDRTDRENNDTLIAKTSALEIVVLALLREHTGNDRLWRNIETIAATLWSLRDASPRSAAQADEMQDFLDSWRHATGPNPARPE